MLSQPGAASPASCSQDFHPQGTQPAGLPAFPKPTLLLCGHQQLLPRHLLPRRLLPKEGAGTLRILNYTKLPLRNEGELTMPSDAQGQTFWEENRLRERPSGTTHSRQRSAGGTTTNSGEAKDAVTGKTRLDLNK